MKYFFYFLSFLILISTCTISLGLSNPSPDEQNHSIEASQSNTYRVHFLSLKRGHKIASSYFTLEDHNKLEIKIPGEEFLEPRGDYTKDGLQFKASFEGTIIKQEKHYHYTLNISGFSLLDTYIAGTMVLNESIKETHQDQEITFLFVGTSEENDTPNDQKRTLFPF